MKTAAAANAPISPAAPTTNRAGLRRTCTRHCGANATSAASSTPRAPIAKSSLLNSPRAVATTATAIHRRRAPSATATIATARTTRRNPEIATGPQSSRLIMVKAGSVASSTAARAANHGEVRDHRNRAATAIVARKSSTIGSRMLSRLTPNTAKTGAKTQALRAPM